MQVDDIFKKRFISSGRIAFAPGANVGSPQRRGVRRLGAIHAVDARPPHDSWLQVLNIDEFISHMVYGRS